VARIIGLTGGIASGKSAVAEALRARGAAIVDADLVARQVVEPGQPALADLVARFGSQIVAPDGRLDRKALGEKVFADPTARADLNRITHPRIAAASQAAIARHVQHGAPVVFYEAALLVENKAYEWLDSVIVVAAPPDVQLQRIMARDGLDEAGARARLASQLPLEEKLKHATYVIDNQGDRAALALQIDALWNDLEARYGPLTSQLPSVSGVMAAFHDTDPHDPHDVDPHPDRPPERVLVTGFPAFTARRMAKKILASDPTATVHLLVLPRFAEDAGRFIDELPLGDRGRIRLVTGDVCAMDLGLATAEYHALAAEITTIHHLAGTYYWGVDADTARRINVGGTRGIVDLAADCRRLRRLVHWSTVQVSGRRQGVVLEDELDVGQRFHNHYEATKLAAEVIARDAMRRMPITIVRPGVIVGDSRTGEIDKLDGPYYLIVLFATNAWPVQLPLPGRGSSPLYLTPIDYVIDAGYALGNDDRAAGKTVHLVDADPLPARRVLELVAEHAQTPAPRGFVPASLARALLRAPGLGKLTRAPAAVVDLLSTSVHYHQKNANELLAESGIVCPPFETYVGHLVRYVKEARAARKKGGAGIEAIEDETFDPLA
jgi:dephospho-CoA kinase